MSNVKKNFIYNILYQIFVIFIPLITIPFVSRRMGANSLGIYSYTYSIAYYFTLIGMLGISNYGNREIAKSRSDKVKLKKTFWSIYAIQFVSSVIASIIYIGYSIFFNNYSLITWLQLIFVISVLFDINWFFFGLEKFKLTVTRNIFIKVLSFILILIFIREPDDCWKYTLIISGSTFLSQLIMWKFLFEEIDFYFPTFSEIKVHIKGSLLLFLPVISYSIYKVMDKIMLGWFGEIAEVAYYENAEKIINVPLSIISALGTVMLPKISNLISLNKMKEAKKYLDKSLEFVIFICFGMCFGLIAVGKDFAILYLGEDFAKTGILIKYLAISILFISIANVIRTQFLIPTNHDKEYIISTIIGALINLCLNLLLIPKLDSIGAAIGTIFAEFSVMLCQLIMVSKQLEIKKYLYIFIKFFVKGIIMFLTVTIIGSYIENVVVKIFIQVISGVIIYFILNFKYIISITNFRLLKNKDS